MHGSLLDIPHQERRRFRKHFVNSVHCELTFEVTQVQDLSEAVAVFNPVLFSAARSGAVAIEALKSTQEVIAMERDKSTCVLRSALRSTGMPGTFDAHLDFDLIDQSPGCLR